jgi:hypothetical protein
MRSTERRPTMLSLPRPFTIRFSAYGVRASSTQTLDRLLKLILDFNPLQQNVLTGRVLK